MKLTKDNDKTTSSTGNSDKDSNISKYYTKEELKGPVGAKVKSKIPKSTTCVVCNSKSEEICFFCDYAVCPTHSLKMQVYTDSAKFGNIIQSCPECSKQKDGKQPSKDEAAEIGFFFNIKPYHEWKIIN
jgi:hypothetical protein